MIVKVCGMREADNIRAVAQAGADMIGMIFHKQSKRYVPMVNSQSGIVPDRPSASLQQAVDDSARRQQGVPLVGVFVDDMVQNIVTRIYNFGLDYVQLHGSESPVMIENLRRTVDPDIHPGIKIIKTIGISGPDDFGKCDEYEGVADLLLFDTACASHGGSGRQFDWRLLEAYHGSLPFLLSGGIGPADAAKVRAVQHPRFAGIDINSRFEMAPAVKDADLVREFINKVKQ